MVDDVVGAAATHVLQDDLAAAVAALRSDDGVVDAVVRVVSDRDRRLVFGCLQLSSSDVRVVE